jgi:hypothetical protein
MNRNLSLVARTTFLVGALALGAQALAVPQNPPPANKLQGYSGYELKNVTLNPELAGKKNIDKVVARVDEELKKNVGAVVTGWNASPNAANAQKLVIEPVIDSLHKPSGANRFFAGAAAGSGRILLKVKITEQPSGKVVAEPEFYRHANAVAGAWTFGAHDNAMLEKVTVLLANYLSANYNEAVGGETGFEP